VSPEALVVPSLLLSESLGDETRRLGFSQPAVRRIRERVLPLRQPLRAPQL